MFDDCICMCLLYLYVGEFIWYVVNNWFGWIVLFGYVLGIDGVLLYVVVVCVMWFDGLLFMFLLVGLFDLFFDENFDYV